MGKEAWNYARCNYARKIIVVILSHHGWTVKVVSAT